MQPTTIRTSIRGKKGTCQGLHSGVGFRRAERLNPLPRALLCPPPVAAGGGVLGCGNTRASLLWRLSGCILILPASLRW